MAKKVKTKDKCKCFPSYSRKKNGKWICDDCGLEVAGEPKVITEKQMNTQKEVDRYFKKYGKLPG